MRLSPTKLLAGGLLAGASAFAHHSFMAEFDQRAPVTLEGTVSRIEWVNPHAHFDVDVKSQTGKAVRWTLETGSPGALLARGWKRDTIRIGDYVRVYAYQAKDKSSLAAARAVVLRDGRKFFGGQTDDGGPKK